MTAKKKKALPGATETQKNSTPNISLQAPSWLYQTAFWGLAALLFFPAYFRGLFFAPQQEAALMVAVLVFGLAFTWRWLQSETSLLRTPLDWFALALPVIYLLASIGAVNRGLSINELVENTLYFMVFWSVSRLICDTKDIYILLRVIYISALGVALAGLATATGIIHINDGYNVSIYGGMISSTFQYHNALGVYMAAVLFIGLHLWYKQQTENSSAKFDLQMGKFTIQTIPLLYALGNFLLLTLLMASKSRAGLLVFVLVLFIYLIGLESKQRLYMLLKTGLLGGLAYWASEQFIGAVENGTSGQGWLILVLCFVAVTVIMILLNVGQNFLSGKWGEDGKPYFKAFISLIGLVFLAGCGGLLLKPGIIDKITSFDFLWTAYHRIYYMSSALEMIKERPLLGWGGGGWQEAYEAFLKFSYTARQAHSYYLQVGVEAGLLGILAVLGIWSSFIVTVFKQLKEKTRNSVEGSLIWLLLMIFLMIAGHAAIDFDLSLGAISILLWTVFGMTVALSFMNPSLAEQTKTISVRHNQGSRKFTIGVVALCTAAIFILTGMLAQANSLANAGYNLLNSGNSAEGIDKIVSAAAYNPFNADYSATLARVYIQQGNVTLAQKKAEDLIKQSQYSFNMRNMYVQIALSSGDKEAAARENADIYLLAPNNIESYAAYARNYANLGIGELQAGNLENARSCLEKVLAVSELVKQQEQSITETGRGLWEGLPLQDTDEIYLVKGQSSYFLGNFSEALGYLQQAEQTANADVQGRATLWQAIVYAKSGDLAAADALIERLKTMDAQLAQDYEALQQIPVL